MQQRNNPFGKDLEILYIKRKMQGTDNIVFRCKQTIYEAQYSTFRMTLRQFWKIDVGDIARHIPTETIDNRPLWKKSVDFQMGKRVDFRNREHKYWELYHPNDIKRVLSECEKKAEAKKEHSNRVDIDMEL